MADPITPNDFLLQLQGLIVKNDQDGITSLVQEQQETATQVQKHLLSLPDDMFKVDVLRQLGRYLLDVNARVLAGKVDDNVDINSIIKTDIIVEPLKKI